MHPVQKDEVPVLELPTKYAEAVGYLRRGTFLKTARYREQQWSANRTGAAEPLLEFERAFVKRMAALGIPVFAKTVVVPNEVQARLFVTGKSEWRAGESPHNRGVAVEIVHSLRDDLPKICWEIFHHVGKETARALGLQVEWGGPTKPGLWTLTEHPQPGY